jgi:DNA invertase Pin-like site-specific DNA recombinase
LATQEEKMTGKRIGYIRVSTVDQNPDRQLVDLQLDKKFIDHASASCRNRPQLKTMLEFIREDDVIIVHSMDRLARNVVDLREIVDDIVGKRAEVRFVKENLIFNSSKNSMSNLLLNVMGAMAEFELEFIRERIREGVAIAKAQGKYKGRTRKLNAEKIDLLRQEIKTRNSKSQIAKNLKISRRTLYNYLEEYNIA